MVGTVHAEASLAAAEGLDALPAPPDLLELRVDHFAADPARLEALAHGCAREIIVTVRGAAEGGHGYLDAATRRGLYERFLPMARYIDLELSALPELAAVVVAAKGQGVGWIASFHDFQGCPEAARLGELAQGAQAAGAAIFKVAVLVERARDVANLLAFLDGAGPELPLAVMGMGPLGRMSRLAAAAAGSRLNYGYLGTQAQVPGQWPAAVLRARIDELLQ